MYGCIQRKKKERLIKMVVLRITQEAEKDVDEYRERV
jgi:hypothetical protein